MAKDKRLWILFKAGGKLRRFLRIGLGEDGSFYLTLGLGERKTRIFEGSVTIPAGASSASTDFSQNLVASYPTTDFRHTGYKKSGLVLEKIGTEYRKVSQQNREDLVEATLLEQIYPGPSDHFSEASPRGGDIILPEGFTWLRGENNFKTIEELVGGNPYRVEIWQLPKGTPNVEANASVLGLVVLSVGETPLAIAFCQDATDLARGFLETTKKLVTTSIQASGQ